MRWDEGERKREAKRKRAGKGEGWVHGAPHQRTCTRTRTQRKRTMKNKKQADEVPNASLYQCVDA